MPEAFHLGPDRAPADVRICCPSGGDDKVQRVPVAEEAGL
jgi:hypothetical protein